MRRAHRLAGMSFALVFLLTGAYMRHHFPHLHGGDHGVRMMLRSSHVYILLSALACLALGVGLRPAAGAGRRLAQRVGTGCSCLAPVAFTASFFLEATPGRVQRPLVLAGVLLVVLGVACHGWAAWDGREKDTG